MSQVSVAVRRSAVLGLLPPDLAAPQLARGPMLRAHEVAGNSEVLASLTGRGNPVLAQRLSRAVAGIEEQEPGLQMPAPGGEHLPGPVLERMNALFEHDFSHVRIRRDRAAADAAADLHAHAFALGADLFFGSGEFSPATPEGERLLVHELTHVVQADEGRLPTGGGVSSPSDPSEREAYANEGKLGGAPVASAQSGEGPTVSRASEEEDLDGAAGDTPDWEGEAVALLELASDVPELPCFAPAADTLLHQQRLWRAFDLTDECMALAETLARSPEVTPEQTAEWEDARSLAERSIEAGVLSAGIWSLAGWQALLGILSVVNARIYFGTLEQRSRALTQQLDVALAQLKAAESDAREVGLQVVMGIAIEAGCAALLASSAAGGPLAIAAAILVRFAGEQVGGKLDEVLGPEVVVGRTEGLGQTKEVLVSVGPAARTARATSCRCADREARSTD